MAFGPGKYDSILMEALKKANAKEGILIIFDGEKVPSFCAQLRADHTLEVPKMLRYMATQVDLDIFSKNEIKNEH